MGSCISNDAVEDASPTVGNEVEDDATTKFNLSDEENDNDIDDNDNDNDDDDIIVDTAIEDDDKFSGGFPYNPTNPGGGILSDEWKLRKFHSTLYDYDLIGYIDDDKMNDYIVIDVRDPNLDYPGGHITGAINIYHEDFIKKLPELVDEYNMKSKIIIHCMYSQSRGPMCCKNYCLAIESLLKYHNNNDYGEIEQCIKQNQDFEILKSINLDDKLYDNLLNQQIYVLKNGFRGFVNKFRENTKYVTDFDIKHWHYENIGGAKELYHKNDW